MAENATPTMDDGRRAGQDDGGQDRVLTTETRGEEQQRRHEHGTRQRTLPEKRAAYLTIIGLFLSLFVAFSAREGRGRRGARPPIGPFDVTLLSLATFRLARVLSFDQVAEPIRAPVAESKPGRAPAEPKGRGVQRALGELITCPLCIGVWVSTGLTYGMLLFPKPTRVFMTIFGAAGAAEIMNYGVTALEGANKLAQQRAKAESGSS